MIYKKRLPEESSEAFIIGVTVFINSYWPFCAGRGQG